MNDYNTKIPIDHNIIILSELMKKKFEEASALKALIYKLNNWSEFYNCMVMSAFSKFFEALEDEEINAVRVAINRRDLGLFESNELYYLFKKITTKEQAADALKKILKAAKCGEENITFDGMVDKFVAEGTAS